MSEYNWTKYAFFLCCGLFICLVICPITEGLGLHILERLLYILGACIGAAGCLMPVSTIIQRWSREK